MDKVFNHYIYNKGTINFNSTHSLEEDIMDIILHYNEENKGDNLNTNENVLARRSTDGDSDYLSKIKKSRLTEIILVIYILLVGKRKAQLQSQLTNFSFINLFKALHKKIIWTPLNLEVNSFIYRILMISTR